MTPAASLQRSNTGTEGSFSSASTRRPPSPAEMVVPAKRSRSKSPSLREPPASEGAFVFRIGDAFNDARSSRVLRNASWASDLTSPAPSTLESFPTLLGAESSVATTPSHEHISVRNVLTEQEASNLITFYFEELNPVVALVTPSAELTAALQTHPRYQLLYAAICATGSSFILPAKHPHIMSILRAHISGLLVEGSPATFENIQALYLVSHFKAPDWMIPTRIIRMALSLACELGLHACFSAELASVGDAVRLADRQRLYYLLTASDAALSMRQKMPRFISRSTTTKPMAWANNLGQIAMDIDYRAAVCHSLQEFCYQQLQSVQKIVSNASTASSLSADVAARSQVLEIVAQIKLCAAAIDELAIRWMDPVRGGMNCPVMHCLLLHLESSVTQAIYILFCRPCMENRCFDADRRDAFTQASRLAMYILNNAYRNVNVLRFGSDTVTLAIASASLWVCDNFSVMQMYSPALSPAEAIELVHKVNTAVQDCRPTPYEHFDDLSAFLVKISASLPKAQDLRQAPDGPISCPHETTERIETVHTFLGCPINANGDSGSQPPSSAFHFPADHSVSDPRISELLSVLAEQRS